MRQMKSQCVNFEKNGASLQRHEDIYVKEMVSLSFQLTHTHIHLL